MSFLEKKLFRSSAHFGEVVCFLIFRSCMSYFYVLEINSLSLESFANILSQSISCLFSFFFFYGFLCCGKAFKFKLAPLAYFVLISITVVDGYKKILLQFISECVLPVFQ